jgi:GAF domain-containing protein
VSTPIRVLILEDRPEDAELAILELRRAGYEPGWQRVETETAYLAALDPPPELILADYNLPQFDGARALALLQARGLDVPFIMVSGTVSEEAAVACVKQGATDYLLKDRLARLGPAVRQALEAVSTADVLTDARAFSLPRWAAEHAEAGGLRAVVAVPLVVQGEPLGALSLSDVLGRVFEDEEIRLLAAVADQAALAIASGRLHEETRRRLAETETLLAVGRAIGATLDLTEAMRRVAREFGRVIEADMVGAYAPTEDGRALHAMAGYHVPPDRLDVFRQLRVPLVDHPFLAEARATRRPVWSSDVPTDPRIDREIVARLPHRSLLFVPMFAKDALLGGLFAAWWTQARTFGADELRLAEGIGRQAALALENARTSSW